MKNKMTQEERLDYLIKAFQAESSEYKNLSIPSDREDKRHLLRSLMNVRMPKEISKEVLAVQDEYLKTRLEEKGIVKLSAIPLLKNGLSIWKGDITRLAVDAIVNAANSRMLGCFVPMHHCIDNCIHTFAGIQLRAECEKNMKKLEDQCGKQYSQPTALPMLTDAYNLPAKKVIHVVGPIVPGKLTPALEKELSDCYSNVLDLCQEHGLKTVAFCCLSTGLFNFPSKRAAKIAVQTVEEWLAGHPNTLERVIFNVFKDEDEAYYEELLE